MSDEPAPQRAYADLPPAQRRHLHDLRARELGRGENPVGLLGALPFHRERGSDPAAAVAALLAALDHCVDRGFYDATIDLAERGRALTTWSPEQATDRFDFTTKLTTSLAALGRAREAEPLYDEIRAVTTHPLRQIQAAYATAMLYTRHHDPDSRDDLIATGWANIAIALAESNPDPKQRAFQTAFNRNGLALIEVHKGHLDMALQIVEGCLSLLDREIDPGEHRLHRSVLLYNRGQVKAGLGDLEGAIDDYDAVIAQDPHYAEYYLDRGSLRRRLGDDPGALADYGMAITLSPPFPEVFYNRADTRAALGDLEGAVEDFAYVHELDPGNVDALLNRAGLLTELGRWTEAQRDVEAGLTLSPDSALLHCIRGQVAAATARPSQARAAFGAALRLDPGMPEALVGRAGLSFDEGSVGEAIRDLDRAVAVADGAIVRFNRATALAAVGRLNEALSDFDEAARLDPEDEDTVSARTALLLRRELEKPLAAS